MMVIFSPGLAEVCLIKTEKNVKKLTRIRHIVSVDVSTNTLRSNSKKSLVNHFPMVELNQICMIAFKITGKRSNFTMILLNKIEN